MNYYEKILIINPSLEDSAAEEIVEKIKGIITQQSGEIIKIDNWGRRKLAYELNKQQKGNYVMLHFKAPSPTILEIEKYCKMVDSIIKFMVIKITKKKQIEAMLHVPAAAAAKESGDEAKTTAAESAEKAPVVGGDDAVKQEGK